MFHLTTRTVEGIDFESLALLETLLDFRLFHALNPQGGELGGHIGAVKLLRVNAFLAVFLGDDIMWMWTIRGIFRDAGYSHDKLAEIVFHL